MSDRPVSADDFALRRVRRHGLAERAVLHQAARLAAGTLRVSMPDGSVLLFTGGAPGPRAEIAVCDGRAFARLLRGGGLGLAESFIDGDWDSPDLTAVLELGVRNQANLADMLRRNLLLRLCDRTVHLLRRNSRRGARRNITAHYDLGNDFYAAWLDRTMTYSGALFRGDGADLTVAQTNKFRHMASLAGIGPNHHVLEIGCGWGGFALWAAQEIGCRVTAVTLSLAQRDYCQRVIANAGLADRVDVRCEDYRDVGGRFDRIVSIEMLEAVGERQWPLFARRLRDLLRPGGRAALQVIVIDDSLFAGYRRRVDFIQRYVFPGGMLPSPGALRAAMAGAGLSWQAENRDGPGYARTLALWRQAFADAGPEVVGLDRRFRRLWHYYLCYCEAGFRSGRLDLLRVSIGRP